MTDEINDKNKMDVEKIYEGELNFKEIKNNPILKPIAIINNSFVNLELTIRKALWDLEQDRKKMAELIEANPKYSETIIMNVVNNMTRNTKTIIHAQDIQKDNMKDTIREMISIADEEYALLSEEENYEVEEEIETPKIIKREPKIIQKQEPQIQEPPQENEIPEEKVEEEEIKEEKQETEDEKFYSDFLEKEVVLPKSAKSDGFTPIKKSR
jgi:hypothetical protein